MKINNRLNNISPSYINKIEGLKGKILESGKEIIDLSCEESDITIHQNITEAFVNAILNKDCNTSIKYKIIKYYEDTFNVKLAEDEVIIFIKDYEGIKNIIPAVCNIGDYAIIPKPSHPIYEFSSNLMGVNSYKISLKSKNKYLPNLEEIPKDIVIRSKLFLINYPNSPTASIATEEFYKEIIDFCYKNNIVLCNDASYNEIIRGNKSPISLMKYDINKKCVEIGSFSKLYNMAGFGIEYAVGNKEVLKAMLKIKENFNPSQLNNFLKVAEVAIDLPKDYILYVRNTFQERIDLAEKILKEKNIDFYKNQGTFYIWCKVPKDYTTDEFCRELLKKHGVLVLPGYVFGSLCHGYFRISVVKDIELIKRALESFKIF